MTNLENEYELFRSLCLSNVINHSLENALLIKKIKKKGLKIIQKERQFYLKDKIVSLSENKIRKLLSSGINNLIHNMDIFYQINSTNRALVEKELNGQYSVLMTEFQMNGEGRRSKKWISPLADNIYVSIKFSLKDIKNANLIPLLTAISICKSLKKSGINGCLIKWPNDIYLEGKKLSGILVESRYNKKEGSVFVVGIGLNVNMQINDQIDQLWTSLRNHKKKMFDRNIILSSLLSETLQTYNKLSEIDLGQFMSEWKLFDYLYDADINVIEEKKAYSAIAQGISKDGALLIKVPGDNCLRKIYSADVSINLNAPNSEK